MILRSEFLAGRSALLSARGRLNVPVFTPTGYPEGRAAHDRLPDHQFSRLSGLVDEPRPSNSGQGGVQLGDGVGCGRARLTRSIGTLSADFRVGRARVERKQTSPRKSDNRLTRAPSVRKPTRATAVAVISTQAVGLTGTQGRRRAVSSRSPSAAVIMAGATGRHNAL